MASAGSSPACARRGHAERTKRRCDVTLDSDHLGVTVGAGRPRLDQLAHGQLDGRVVEQHRLGPWQFDVDSRGGDGRRRELGADVAVHGQRVVGLEPADSERQVEDVGQPGDRRVVDGFAAQRPLVGDDRRPRPRLQQRGQLRPRVLLGDDLGQRADRETSRSLVEYTRRPVRRRQQRQAVLGERRGRPQLASRAHHVAATVA